MNDSQQRDVVIYQLLPYEPGLTLREREKILGEESGLQEGRPSKKGEGIRRARSADQIP